MHRADRVGQLLRIPGENVAIGGARDQSLSLLHPLYREKRMLLLMQRFSDELRRSSFPVVPRRFIGVRKVVAAVAVVRHDTWPIFHLEIGLPKVPVVILARLSVQFVLLLFAKLDSEVVSRRV